MTKMYFGSTMMKFLQTTRAKVHKKNESAASLLRKSSDKVRPGNIFALKREHDQAFFSALLPFYHHRMPFFSPHDTNQAVSKVFDRQQQPLDILVFIQTVLSNIQYHIGQPSPAEIYIAHCLKTLLSFYFLSHPTHRYCQDDKYRRALCPNW